MWYLCPVFPTHTYPEEEVFLLLLEVFVLEEVDLLVAELLEDVFLLEVLVFFSLVEDAVDFFVLFFVLVLDVFEAFVLELVSVLVFEVLEVFSSVVLLSIIFTSISFSNVGIELTILVVFSVIVFCVVLALIILIPPYHLSDNNT